MDDSGKGGGSGLTSNQRSILGARQGDLCNGEDGWKLPVGFVGVMSLVGFVLGCVATDMARNNANAIDAIEFHPTPICAFGDNLKGEEVVQGHDDGSFYQVAGAHGAAMTWTQAYMDAKSRCYNGHPGYLAIIGTQGENDFLHGLIQSAPGYAAGDNAWVGATDTGEEGSFAWIGPQKMSTGGLVFYENDKAVDGSFINWAEGEPNEGGDSGTSEDCVAMYGGGEGKWFDRNCYYAESYFLVEFGPPVANIEETWAKEHPDEALDDEVFTQTDDNSKDDKNDDELKKKKA